MPHQSSAALKLVFEPQACPHACGPHHVSLICAPEGVAAFMDLHETVLAHTSFVKPRSLESVKQHIDAGHIAIGIHAHDGEMVAQALLAFPDKAGATNTNGYPIGDHAHKTAIIQTVGIHPDHKNCGLPKILFAAAADIAAQQGRTHIVAKTQITNVPARKAFEKAGYKPLGTPQTVAGDTYPSVFLVQKTNKPKVSI